ncbi:hypothetical protein [Amycolatopsis sp. GA6-003]
MLAATVIFVGLASVGTFGVTIEVGANSVRIAPAQVQDVRTAGEVDKP